MWLTVPIDFESGAPTDFESFEEARDQFLEGFVSTMEICVMKPDGSGLVRVSEPEVDAQWPGLSYDGSTVIYRSDGQ